MTADPPGWSAPDFGSAQPPPPPPPPGWGAAAGWTTPGAQPPPPPWGALPNRNESGWAPPPPPPEIRPGVVPLRPLGVGELIDGAISTMRRHWKVMLGLSAIVVTAVSVLQAGALYLLFRSTAGLETADDLSAADTGELVASNAALGVTLVIGQLAQIVLVGVLTIVVSRAVLGEDVSAGQAWRAVRGRLWRLIALSFLILLAAFGLVTAPVLLGVAVYLAGAPAAAAIGIAVAAELVAVPAAVWLYVKLGVAAPALVLERASIGTACRRSARLVRRGWWRVFGILLLAAFMVAFLGGIIQVPFTVGAELSELRSDRLTPGIVYYVLTTVGASIAGTITYPFTAGVSALLYIDLRMRREGLDLTLIRAAAAPAPGPAAHPAPQWSRQP